MPKGFGRKSTIDWVAILEDCDGNTMHDRLENFLEEFPSLTAIRIEIESRTGKKISLSTISRKYRSFGLTLLNHRDLWDDDPVKVDYKRYENSNLPRFNYREHLEQYFKDNPKILKQVQAYNKAILEKGGDSFAEHRDVRQGLDATKAGDHIQAEDSREEVVQRDSADDVVNGGCVQVTLF
jgi:hypothetical protein